MPSIRSAVFALVVVAFAGAAPARSETAVWPPAGFILTLSEPDVAAAGLTKLSEDEQAALNACVAREIALARAGNVRGFAGTFIGRRSAQERAQSGLDRLTPDEQSRLNMLVAIALAAGPVAPQSASSLGKDAMDVANRLQVHGEVSFTVGGGSGGRSFYGTSVFTTITDPETNLTIGVGYAEYHGNGYFGYGPGDYYYPDAGFGGRGFGSGCFRRH